MGRGVFQLTPERLLVRPEHWSSTLNGRAHGGHSLPWGRSGWACWPLSGSAGGRGRPGNRTLPAHPRPAGSAQGSTIQTLPVEGREPPRTLLQSAGVFPNSWAGTKIAIGELLRGRWRTGVLSTAGPASVEWDETYLYVVKSAAPDERRKLHLVTGWLDELRKLALPRR